MDRFLLEQDIGHREGVISPRKVHFRLLHAFPRPKLRLVCEGGVEADQEEGERRKQLDQHLSFDLLAWVWAAGCVKGFVTCFLEVPFACLGSMATVVQPYCLWNSQKTCYKTFTTTCRPRLRIIYLSVHVQYDLLADSFVACEFTVQTVRLLCQAA